MAPALASEADVTLIGGQEYRRADNRAYLQSERALADPERATPL